MKKSRYTEEQIAFALKQAETGLLLRAESRARGLGGHRIKLTWLKNGANRFTGSHPSEEGPDIMPIIQAHANVTKMRVNHRRHAEVCY